MKIKTIDYDDDGTRYEDEVEIAPWNILETRVRYGKVYILKMVGQEYPYYIEKEDYEKIIKYIRKKEKQ